MIVPRYYEDLIMFRHPKEWTTWWNTGKNQTVCSY